MELIHAYRHLYRAVLKAVCYSQPASTTARDLLRRAFRDKTGTFDATVTRRTIWFLKNAAKERGKEHKIVKNMLFIQWSREKNSRSSWKQLVNSNFVQKRDPVKDTAHVHYERTIAMLNKTMGLCLPGGVSLAEESASASPEGESASASPEEESASASPEGESASASPQST